MSLRKLIGWTVFDLALAVLIGTGLAIAVFAIMFPYRPARELGFCYGLHSLGVPLTTPGVREMYDRASSEWKYTLMMDCQAAPANDQTLADWFRGQATFDLVEIGRMPSARSPRRTAATVVVTLIGPQGREALEVPWEQLGYKPASFPPFWQAHGPFMQDGPPAAGFRLILIGFLQIGFTVVGLVRGWRNQRVAVEPPPRWEWQTVPTAIGVAVVLTGLFWVYLQAVRHFFAPSLGLADYLYYLPSVGWYMPLQDVMMTVQPSFLQLVAGVVLVLGVPLAQGVFFRIGLLWMWKTAGRFWVGAVVSALAAAVLLLDWTTFPVMLVAGLALAWLQRWSGSFLAPVLAHILFNAAILCMVYGLIPSLPHPIDQLCGQWEEMTRVDPKDQGKDAGKPPRPDPKGDEETVPFGPRRLLDFPAIIPPPEIEFLRGGTIRGGRVVSKDVQLTPNRYEWVGPDEIEVRWERAEHIGAMSMKVTLEFVRYKVAVNWKELTLTRESDGKVFRYRRSNEVYRGKVSSPKFL